MLKKLLAVLIMSVLVLSLATPLLAQDPQKDKPKKDRWEGIVTLISKDKSTLVVRKRGSDEKKTIAFDAMTEWSSAEHGSKKATAIDVSQVKEGDRVICVGTFDKDGVLHATLISKRLSS